MTLKLSFFVISNQNSLQFFFSPSKNKREKKIRKKEKLLHENRNILKEKYFFVFSKYKLSRNGQTKSFSILKEAQFSHMLFRSDASMSFEGKT